MDVQDNLQAAEPLKLGGMKDALRSLRSQRGLAMNTQTATESVTAGSFGLIWTLIARSVGLTAGLAVAMLIVAALLSAP
jgi:hypothetical protein